MFQPKGRGSRPQDPRDSNPAEEAEGDETPRPTITGPVLSPERAPAFLLVKGGPQAGRAHPLRKSRVVVGRSARADVRILDRTVASQHLSIIHSDEGYELEALAPSSGIYVGAERVLSRTPLRNGDRIRIGKVDTVFLTSTATSSPTMALVPTGGRQAIMPPLSYEALPRPVVEEDREPSLREIVSRGLRIYRFLRLHAGVFAFLAAAGIGAGVASAFLMPSAIGASCELKLMPHSKSNPISEEGLPGGLQFFANAERAFTNPELVRSTLAQAKLPTDDPMVAALASQLKLESVTDNLYTAVVKNTRFERGAADPVTLLGAHVDNYIKSEIDKNLRVLNAEAEFLRARVADTDAALKKIGSELVSFRESNAGALLEGQRPAMVDVGTQRAELVSRILRLRGELESAERQRAAGTGLAHSRVQASQSHRQALIDIDRRIEEARARGLGEEHTDVRRLRDERRGIEALLARQLESQESTIERAGNLNHQQLEVSVANLQAQLRAALAEQRELDRGHRRAREVAEALPEIDSRLQELTRADQAQVQLRDQLFEKLKKTELQLDLERVSASSRYEITVPPRLEAKSLSTTLALRFALGLVLGLALAGVVVMVRETRRVVAEITEAEHAPYRPNR